MMLEFLKQADIDEEIIDKLLNEATADEIISFEANEEECLKTIVLFKTLGINNINELLLNEKYLFFKLTNRIVDIISKYDIKSLVNNINNDYTYIEQII